MHAILTWFSITQQDFFETTYFNQPDIAMPAAWKQLAELTRLDWLSTALELYRTINDIMIPPPEPYDIMQNDPNNFMQDSDTTMMTSQIPFLHRMILCRLLRELFPSSKNWQMLEWAHMDVSTRCQGQWPSPCHSMTYIAVEICFIWWHKAFPMGKWKLNSVTILIWNLRMNEEPCGFSCRDDGWHHVPSSGYQAAWCSIVYQGCSEGSSSSCWGQPLGTHQEKRCPTMHWHSTGSTGNAPQMKSHDEQNQESEG